MSSHTDAWIGTKRGGAARWMERAERGAMHELGARVVNEVAARGFAAVVDRLAAVEVLELSRAPMKDVQDALEELHDFFSGRMEPPTSRAARGSFGLVKKPAFAYLLDSDADALHLFRALKLKGDKSKSNMSNSGGAQPAPLDGVIAPPGLALVASIPATDVAAMQLIVEASSWPLGSLAKGAWEHTLLEARRDPAQRALLEATPMELMLMKLERRLPKDATLAAKITQARASDAMDGAPSLVAAADASLLPRLVAKGDELVLRAVAQRPDLDDALRSSLRGSKHPRVAQALARNPTTPAPLLVQMYVEGDDDVKESVVENPAVPLEVVEIALTSGSARLRERAAFWSATNEAHELVLRLADASVRRWLAANPRIASELHARLAADDDAAVREAALANRRMP